MERMKNGTVYVYVNVTGMYLMRNIGFKNLTMYFPVPNETIRDDEIRVYVNGIRYKYEITYEAILKDRVEKYWTMYGPLPLVKWEMDNLNSFENYIVRVTYTYRIKSDDGNYAFLYALGTGRFYYTYSKQCIADIWFTLKGLKDYSFEMMLADYKKQNITVVETLNIEKDEERIYKKLVSPWFAGSKQDLVVYLSKSCGEDMWVPGKPSSANVKQVYYFAENKTLVIILEMIFPNPGYRITKVTKTIHDNIYIADIEMLKYTGPVIQVITKKEVPINFTGVEPGNYTIIIKINGEETVRINIDTGLITATTTTASTTSSSTNGAGEPNAMVAENYLPLLVSGAIILLS